MGITDSFKNLSFVSLSRSADWFCFLFYLTYKVDIVIICMDSLLHLLRLFWEFLCSWFRLLNIVWSIAWRKYLRALTFSFFKFNSQNADSTLLLVWSTDFKIFKIVPFNNLDGSVFCSLTRERSSSTMWSLPLCWALASSSSGTSHHHTQTFIGLWRGTHWPRLARSRRKFKWTWTNSWTGMAQGKRVQERLCTYY
jgi:hypothetical protein